MAVEFNKLVQTGNVLEYIEKFEELKAVLLCKNSHLDESYFVSSFISRLKWGLKPMVRLMRPNTLGDAIEIAQFREQTVDQIIKKHDSQGRVGNGGNNEWLPGYKKNGTYQSDVKTGGEKKTVNTASMFKKISLYEK